MPTWVSNDGEWFPANEHAVLPHLAGTKDEVYDGPDRAAMEELAKIYGVDSEGFPKEITVGMPFKDDPMLQDLARQLGFKDVMEYARSRGYDPEKAKKDFEEKASQIIKHQPPDKNPERNLLGGGIDTSGKGADLIGGFGVERERPANEVKK